MLLNSKSTISPHSRTAFVCHLPLQFIWAVWYSTVLFFATLDRCVCVFYQLRFQWRHTQFRMKWLNMCEQWNEFHCFVCGRADDEWLEPYDATHTCTKHWYLKCKAISIGTHWLFSKRLGDTHNKWTMIKSDYCHGLIIISNVSIWVLFLSLGNACFGIRCEMSWFLETNWTLLFLRWNTS